MVKYIVPVIGLDVGTAKTVAAVGWRNEKHGVEIIGAAMVRTRGIERGVVHDPAAAAATIEEALRKVDGYLRERSARQRSREWRFAPVPTLCLSIGGDHMLGSNTKGMLTLGDRPIEITPKDMRRAISAGASLAMPGDRDVMHTLPQEFIIDGHTRSRDPRGIFAGRLGVHLHIISGNSAIVKNMVRAVHRVGYDIEGVIYNGIATSEAILTEQDKERGTVVLELGAGTVNILWYRGGSLQYSGVLGHGGRDITRALAEELGIDEAQAEYLKMHYQSPGQPEASFAAAEEDKIIIKKHNAVYESISRATLARRIDAALETLLELIRQEMTRAGISLRDNRVVLAGGMTFMDGIIETVEQSLSCSARIGTLRGFVSAQHGIGNMFYATGIGTVLFALTQEQDAMREPLSGPRVIRVIAERLRQWYEEYF